MRIVALSDVGLPRSEHMKINSNNSVNDSKNQVQEMSSSEVKAVSGGRFWIAMPGGWDTPPSGPLLGGYVKGS